MIGKSNKSKNEKNTFKRTLVILVSIRALDRPN